MGGHFIAYCKHRILNEWYCYNDAAVTRLNDQENGYKKGVPYILFYESIQGDKNILYENIENNEIAYYYFPALIHKIKYKELHFYIHFFDLLIL